MFKLKITLDSHNAKPSHFSLLSTFKKNHKFVNLFRLVQKVYVHTELMLITNYAKICQEIHEHCTERKIRGKVFMKFTSHSSTEVGSVRTYSTCLERDYHLFRQLQPEVSMVDTSELIACSGIIFICAR